MSPELPALQCPPVSPTLGVPGTPGGSPAAHSRHPHVGATARSQHRGLPAATTGEKQFQPGPGPAPLPLPPPGPLGRSPRGGERRGRPIPPRSRRVCGAPARPVRGYGRRRLRGPAGAAPGRARAPRRRARPAGRSRPVPPGPRRPSPCRRAPGLQPGHSPGPRTLGLLRGAGQRCPPQPRAEGGRERERPGRGGGGRGPAPGPTGREPPPAARPRHPRQPPLRLGRGHRCPRGRPGCDVPRSCHLGERNGSHPLSPPGHLSGLPWGWGAPTAVTLRTGFSLTCPRRGWSPCSRRPDSGAPSALSSTRCWLRPGGWLGSSSCTTVLPQHSRPRSSCPRPTPGREQCASGPGWAPRGWPRWVPGSPPCPSSGCLSPFLASFLPRLLPVLLTEPPVLGSPPSCKDPGHSPPWSLPSLTAADLFSAETLNKDFCFFFFPFQL